MRLNGLEALQFLALQIEDKRGLDAELLASLEESTK
jgi:hypothetical protein